MRGAQLTCQVYINDFIYAEKAIFRNDLYTIDAELAFPSRKLFDCFIVMFTLFPDLIVILCVQLFLKFASLRWKCINSLLLIKGEKIFDGKIKNCPKDCGKGTGMQL